MSKLNIVPALCKLNPSEIASVAIKISYSFLSGLPASKLSLIVSFIFLFEACFDVYEKTLKPFLIMFL